ncbi:uncharacterized protein DSM5745_08845 [Aspergillus mulundensis]|uniref:HAD-like protein n=1 Tax=Aspergillus mulundensis TaxID=1810919 RepID=A0A3D8R4V6_9EURO|nr:hypothetical protein DSM5745_08845 [Aspergillus mulundensis]RDW69085.1 hypothetical protein DSM5745_08845 [Aspergillus mulundensis]
MPPIKAIILDLWDLLLPRQALPTSPKIPRQTIRQILDSDIWANYERGKLSESKACRQIAARYTLDKADVTDILRQARVQGPLEQNAYLHVMENLRAIKAEAQAEGAGKGTGISLCAMLNVPAPAAECESLRALIADCVGDDNVFDRVFLSHEVGMRKPDLCFYGHVLSELGLAGSAEKALFVESEGENVLAVKSLGARVILHYGDVDNTLRLIQNALGDAVAYGKWFLRANAKRMFSVTGSGVEVRENLSQLVILEVTGDSELVSLKETSRTWNFLQEKPLSSISAYPDDFDTTALALTVLDRDEKVVHAVMDEMAKHVSADGIVLTYFDRTRHHVDPIVCTNVLRLFHKYSRGSELSKTISWVRDVLKNRAYIDGTRYYVTPEAFLYTMSRLLQCTEGHALEGHAELVSLLRDRVAERIGLPGDAVALSMRLLVCLYVGVEGAGVDVDEDRLREMQGEDGGWETGWVYRNGWKSNLRIGNRGMATALAVRALETLERVRRARMTQSPSPMQRISRLFSAVGI